ncbi:tellurite resistance TerB family protein [Ostreibacterium oceani]|uniref:DUF533 domain-containing protein n=1 Tax=Ostreibacterium oceani TaxID=2654998 RepID=A0A6N7EWD8_9GAMM|nr:tellurite resistance TerB family protein [Ostreibacterium oceani]MPV85417.1 DUF533 domain-containing protein [Ostreibacterium oceani]
MKASDLLGALLSAGQDMANQGKTIASEKLNVPESGAERSAMLGGMGKGALAAGALALLVGTDTGREIGGSALKIGSVAALGGLAFKAYKNWQTQNAAAESTHTDTAPANSAPAANQPPPALSHMSESEIDARSKKLLSAMIAAAKADGHIDAKETEALQSMMDQLGESNELSAFMQSEIAKPLNPQEIAANTDAPGLAAEVYLMSRLVINDENFMEKAYLGELVKSLNLDPALIAQLDAQATSAQA